MSRTPHTKWPNGKVKPLPISGQGRGFQQQLAEWVAASLIAATNLMYLEMNKVKPFDINEKFYLNFHLIISNYLVSQRKSLWIYIR